MIIDMTPTMLLAEITDEGRTKMLA